MPAVKRLRHRSLKRVRMKISREHRGPGDGLERRPVRAERRTEDEDENKFAGPNEHENKLVRFGGSASAQILAGIRAGTLAIFRASAGQPPG